MAGTLSRRAPVDRRTRDESARAPGSPRLRGKRVARRVPPWQCTDVACARAPTLSTSDGADRSPAGAIPALIGLLDEADEHVRSNALESLRALALALATR
jgi:hypothetical protein